MTAFYKTLVAFTLAQHFTPVSATKKVDLSKRDSHVSFRAVGTDGLEVRWTPRDGGGELENYQVFAKLEHILYADPDNDVSGFSFKTSPEFRDIFAEKTHLLPQTDDSGPHSEVFIAMPPSLGQPTSIWVGLSEKDDPQRWDPHQVPATNGAGTSLAPDIQHLWRQLAAKDAEIEQLKSQVEDQIAAIAEKNAAIENLESQLRVFESSAASSGRLSADTGRLMSALPLSSVGHAALPVSEKPHADSENEGRSQNGVVLMNHIGILETKARSICKMLGLLIEDHAHPHSVEMRHAARVIKDAVKNVQGIFKNKPEPEPVGPMKNWKAFRTEIQFLSETPISEIEKILTYSQQGFQAIQQATDLIRQSHPDVESPVFKDKKSRDRDVFDYLDEAQEYLRDRRQVAEEDISKRNI